MNVMRLRAVPPVEVRPGGSNRMPDITIDLQRAIDGVRALMSDLEAYYWERAGSAPRDSQRFQISHWIRQLSDRSAGLESIVMHKGSVRLRLCDVSADEAKGLEEALVVLERWVCEEDP